MKFISTIKNEYSKLAFKFDKNKPEILVIGGVVAGVFAVGSACYATFKVCKVVDRNKEAIDTNSAKLNEIYEREDRNDLTPNSLEIETECKKALKESYKEIGIEALKMYSLPVSLCVLSTTSILSGFKILKARNVVLASTNAALMGCFNEYRKRVVNEYGDEVDKKLLHGELGTKPATISVDPETGEVESTEEEANPNSCSPIAVLFDETNRNWTKDPYLNIQFLRALQQQMNDRLRAHGHLFLNEVYDELQVPRTSFGQIYGWVYDPTNKDSIGDNFVDFGINDYMSHTDTERAFLRGEERSIWLDFNVDGDILNVFCDSMN